MSETTRDIVLKDMADSAERMGLDLEDLQEMIEDVLEDCTAKLATLKEAGEVKNAVQIKEIAHDIKGATANYGLLTASAIAKEIEQNHESSPVEKIDILIDEISCLSSLNLSSE